MDPESPESSPVKSHCSSPQQSPVSSCIPSPISSPIRSIPSSPYKYVPPRVPPSPFDDVPSSPPEPEPISSPLQIEQPESDDNTQAKRMKFNEDERHCQILFSDDRDDAVAGVSSEPLKASQPELWVHMQDPERKECDTGETEETQQHCQQVLYSTIMAGSNNHQCHDHTQQIVLPSTGNHDICGNEDQLFGNEVLTERAGLHCDVNNDEPLTESSSGEGSVDSSVGEGSTESSIFESDESSSESECESIYEPVDSDSETVEFWSPSVYAGTDLTVDEGVLHIMNLFTKYKLSKKAVGGILKTILKFIPGYNNMPKTEYSLFEFVKKLSPVSEEIVHYYCSQCLFYLGLEEMKCNICGGESHKFYQLPIADQIRNLFEQHNLADNIGKYLQERNISGASDSYSDMLDGSEFKRARIDGPYNLTLMGHTDGISVSESSDVSLWPVEWVLAELPPNLRFKFVLISGIWLDECKPYMNTLMKPFAAELQALHSHGVQWVHPRTKETHTTYVTVPSFCVDAPVRAQLQNILLHGGKHCCRACEQKMKKLPPQPVILGKKRESRRRVYTFEEEPALLRTAERMNEQGKEARRKLEEEGGKLNPEKGVKGPSVISDIPGCDRSTAVFPEYMHLLSCIPKALMTLWFVKDGPWTLKEFRDFIDNFLTSVRVPDFITRVPRSTQHYSKWKANELRSFLLYFSVIIFSRCMKPEYFQHWLLLVSAFYLLLQDCVSKTDVQRADILLRMFCRDFAKLYSPKYFTYYVHNLLHLAITVERHGALHSNSAFRFEDFNGTLAQYIHGFKNQGKELVNNVRLAFGVEVLKARCLPNVGFSHEHVIEFRNQIKGFCFSAEEIELLSTCCKYKEPMKVYFRAVISRDIFTSCHYTRQKKRNNFTICYQNSCNNKVFGEIKYFCESGNQDKIAIVEKFDVDHLRTFCHDDTGTVIKYIVPIIRSGSMDVIDLTAILFKVVKVDDFICMRPNKHEYNL